MIKYARQTPDQTKSAIRMDAMGLLGFDPRDHVQGLVGVVLLLDGCLTKFYLAIKLQNFSSYRHGQDERAHPGASPCDVSSWLSSHRN